MYNTIKLPWYMNSQAYVNIESRGSKWFWKGEIPNLCVEHNASHYCAVVSLTVVYILCKCLGFLESKEGCAELRYVSVHMIWTRQRFFKLQILMGCALYQTCTQILFIILHANSLRKFIKQSGGSTQVVLQLRMCSCAYLILINLVKKKEKTFGNVCR